MMRRLFKKQAELVASGGDPVGATQEQAYAVKVVAGNAILDGQTGECVAGHDGRN